MSFPPTDRDPGAQLAWLAARASRDPQARTDLRQMLGQPLDWDRVVGVAARHRLLPIAARAVLDYAPDCVSPETLATLRSLYLANTRESGRRLHQLLTVLGALEEAGIRALPLKGPVLACTVYEDVGLRMSSDLDVLVSRASLPATMATLRALEYQPRLKMGERQISATMRFECELTFVAPSGLTPVELHWGIVPRRLGCPLDPERIASRAQPVPVLGRSVLWPCPGDQFLILCLHGAKHFWGRLEMLHSLTELVVDSPDLDWEGVLAEASVLGSRRRCLLGASLAATVMAAPIPDALLLEARSEPEVARLAKEVIRCLFSTVRVELPLLEAMRWDMATLDTISRRTAYVFMHTLVPGSADWVLLPLPQRLYPLYYLFRPFRLLAKYARRWVRPARRTPDRPEQKSIRRQA